MAVMSIMSKKTTLSSYFSLLAAACSALLLSANTVAAAVAAEDITVASVSHVIESFDEVRLDEWDVDVLSGEGYLNFSTTEDKALHINYSVVQTQNWGGYSAFSNTLEEGPISCVGADYLSLRLKIVQPQSLPNRAHLRIVLVDGSDGDDFDFMERYYSFQYVLDNTNDDWMDLQIPLVGDENPDSPFSIPGWSGIKGNSRLDLQHLRGWTLEWNIDSQAGLGSASIGTLLLDQMACVGDLAFSSALRDSDQQIRVEVEREDGTFLLPTNLTFDTSSTEHYLSTQYDTVEDQFIISYEHLALRQFYYNLSQHTTSILLQMDWSPEQQQYAFVSLSLFENESDSDNDTMVFASPYTKLLPSDSSTIMNSNSSIAQQIEVDINDLVYSSNGTTNTTKVIDAEKVKGFKISISIVSTETTNEPMVGNIQIFNLLAIEGNATKDDNATDDSDDDGIAEDTCQLVPGITVDTTDSSIWTRFEFLGSRCCEACVQAGDSCMYFLVHDRSCSMAPHSTQTTIANNELLDTRLNVYWKNTAEARGNYCERCVCDAVERSIDCRGQDLIQIPKSFTEELWMPKVLDLRDNPRLSILGQSVFEEIATDLEEIRLPKSIQHIMPQSLNSLPSFLTVVMEEDDNESGVGQIENVISDSSTDTFSDICCSRGDKISLSAPSQGFTFCDMQYFTPGIDAQVEEFVQYFGAASLATLTQSSTFMAEAAESAEKCAEYCAISEDCQFFTYDARIREAEHVCYLLFNNGTSADSVCCNPNDYADAEQTQPGFVSGYPPRTRHEMYDAKVVFAQTNLEVNATNNFTAQYEIRLGSSPRRGAVWVEPVISSPSSEHFSVSISPYRVALYDDQTVATVTIQVTDLQAKANGNSIIVSNQIRACDTAFTASETLSSDGFIYVDIDYEIVQILSKEDSSGTVLILSLLGSGAFLVLIVAYLYVERKKRLANSVWEIDSSDLAFKDPPEIIGQGTFGLVLLAEYRGTQVAVKRVLPRGKPNNQKKSHVSRVFIPMFDLDMSEAAIKDGESQNTEDETLREDLPKPEQGKRSTSSIERGEGVRTLSMGTGSMSGNVVRYNTSKLKADFVSEMRHLSKLRHPNITTVMGAVLDKRDPLLVMEYMDHGSLYDVLHNETFVLEGEQILPILKDVSLGLRFLHASNPQVVHGDIKAANILIDSRLHAKVADFGLSQKKQLDARGTPYWMAPELLRREAMNSASTDVYSFGIVLYEMYSRGDPYEGEDYDTVLKEIADPLICKRPSMPRECPSLMRNLMNECLSHNSAERPTFEKLQKIFKESNVSDADPINRKRLSLQTRSLPQTNKSDQLLYGVFPRHIAEALREGKEIEPESHDLVTIFFSDIVGFTQIAATMAPLQISDLLDRLYSAFDDLSVKHDVFKVETIGDAYMACSNLVTDQSDDHAKRIADFAIDAIQVANETLVDKEDPSRGFISIRVGFHSGPVVANVVGSRNPRYCLFGDTVNTSSRMESHSIKDRIHCSDRSAKLLYEQDPDIRLAPRGLTEIKSKGKMRTYWVNEGSPVKEMVVSLSKKRKSKILHIPH